MTTRDFFLIVAAVAIGTGLALAIAGLVAKNTIASATANSPLASLLGL